MKLLLDNEKCSTCGVCIQKCAFGALSFAANDDLVIDEMQCRLCGACVRFCPSGALHLEEKVHTSSDNSSGIWILIQTLNGQIVPVSLELLGKARDMADKLSESVSAVLIGEGVSTLCEELIERGSDVVHLVDNSVYRYPIDENIVEATAQIVQNYNPRVLLVGATKQGRGVSARLAARLSTGLTADCTELDIDPNEAFLLQTRPAFGGNLMATIKTPYHRPQMASVREGVFASLDRELGRTGEIIVHDASGFQINSNIELISHSSSKQALGNDLSSAKILIGIGRGVGKKELVAKIQKYAQSIGASIVGSRAAIEAGLLEASLQVGQTGMNIAPDLYIALGISGQIQHTAAIGASKKIIAINSDPAAPIFNIADYGFVGSVEDVLPLLERGL